MEHGAFSGSIGTAGEFEMINDVVQGEPADALDPEIMGSLAAIGIVKSKPFNPDVRMKGETVWRQ